MWVEKERAFDPGCSHVTSIRLSVEVENGLPRSVQLNLTKASPARSQHIQLLRAPPQCLELSALFYLYCDLAWLLCILDELLDSENDTKFLD
jgi:hypothetical protein